MAYGNCGSGLGLPIVNWLGVGYSWVTRRVG